MGAKREIAKAAKVVEKVAEVATSVAEAGKLVQIIVSIDPSAEAFAFLRGFDYIGPPLGQQIAQDVGARFPEFYDVAKHAVVPGGSARGLKHIFPDKFSGQAPSEEELANLVRTLMATAPSHLSGEFDKTFHPGSATHCLCEFDKFVRFQKRPRRRPRPPGAPPPQAARRATSPRPRSRGAPPPQAARRATSPRPRPRGSPPPKDVDSGRPL
ncbi:unnamed protein product [Prorocentrum cordatum]|uniref:5-hmdU DNA kinase helical domain-containing protein n=1 Tax=Prorocentrum cordatum TaxID=2364126 RepID=A0ABN9UTH0_9DINO|nr:unnamed protein product [Polarella glacialis]